MSSEPKKKNQEVKDEEKKRLFSGINISKKETNIKSRINSKTSTIRKKNKILNTVEYGDDPNFQKYMIFLDNLRKKNEKEFLELMRERNKKDSYLNKLDINKKISFTDFEEKFQINSYLMNYFDYYEIQKINKRQIKDLIDLLKKRKQEQENKDNKKQIIKDDIIDNTDNDINRRLSIITLQNYNKKNRKSFIGYNDKNNIYIEGIDFNIINKIYPKIEENNKKFHDLYLINEIEKEKKKLNKKMYREVNSKRFKKMNNWTLDEYSIYNRLEEKSQKKLQRLKKEIKNKFNKERPKTTKALLPSERLHYLNYIPNSSKYKHINYQKNLIFNYKSANTNQNDKSKKDYNLILQSNKVINRLKKINSVLRKDKNYTTKTIARANTIFHKTEYIKNDQNLMENLMKNKKGNVNKILKLKEKLQKKEKFSTFNELKEMTRLSDKTSLETTDVFIKSLNSLCKEEKKNNKYYNSFMRSNYDLKLKGAEEFNKENLHTKNNIKNVHKQFEILKLKIKKRYKDINNIIGNSKKISKGF